jgi:heme exporter protein D
MEALNEFLAMGGYAAFVWPAYGLTAVVMIGIVVSSWRGLVRERQILEKLQQQRQGRKVS